MSRRGASDPKQTAPARSTSKSADTQAKGLWTRAHFERLYDEFLGDLDPASSKGRKRARILRVATELFMRQGYRKTSVDEIAHKANVAKGTVYLYFQNKGTLLVHAIGVEKRGLLEVFRPILDGEVSERERLRFYLRVTLTVARELPLVARLMRGDQELMLALEDIDPQLLREGQALGEAWLMELIELAAPGVFDEAQKRVRADVLLSLRYFAGLLLDERVRGGRSLDEFAHVLADMLVYGTLRLPPPPPASGREST